MAETKKMSIELINKNINHRVDVTAILTTSMQMESIIVAITDNLREELPVYQVRCNQPLDEDFNVESELLMDKQGKPIGLGILVGPYTRIESHIGRHKLHRGVSEQAWNQAKKKHLPPKI